MLGLGVQQGTEQAREKRAMKDAKSHVQWF